GPVRLTGGPAGRHGQTPGDPDGAALGTVEAIWRTFCRQIHFFGSREEAQRWAAARGDIAILTPDEGYRIGRLLVSRFLGQAE
ncbi:MAG: organomercurial lyase, partial [Candidatus Rokuibacteriota bacterium]